MVWSIISTAPPASATAPVLFSRSMGEPFNGFCTVCTYSYCYIETKLGRRESVRPPRSVHQNATGATRQTLTLYLSLDENPVTSFSSDIMM